MMNAASSMVALCVMSLSCWSTFLTPYLSFHFFSNHLLKVEFRYPLVVYLFVERFRSCDTVLSYPSVSVEFLRASYWNFLFFHPEINTTKTVKPLFTFSLTQIICPNQVCTRLRHLSKSSITEVIWKRKWVFVFSVYNLWLISNDILHRL